MLSRGRTESPVTNERQQEQVFENEDDDEGRVRFGSSSTALRSWRPLREALCNGN